MDGSRPSELRLYARMAARANAVCGQESSPVGWLDGSGGLHRDSLSSQGELGGVLPVSAGAAVVTARLEKLPLRRMCFREPVVQSFFLEQSKRNADLLVGQLVPVLAFVKLAEQDMPARLSDALAATLSELDSLFGDLDAVVELSNFQLELAEAQQYVALRNFGTCFIEMPEGGAKCVPSSLCLALSHQQQAELILAPSHQCGVVFECVKSQCLVGVLDRPAELTSLLVRNAEPVIRPAHSGQIAHRACGQKGFLIERDSPIVGVVMHVDGRDVFEDPSLSSGKARLGGAAQVEGMLRDRQCAAVLFEVESARLPVSTLNSQPGVWVFLQKRLRSAQVLQAFVRSVRAHHGLAHVVPHERFEPRRHSVLEHREPERDCIVESLLQAQRLELSDPSVGCARTARQRIVQEKGLDRLTCAAGDELERSHRRPRLAGLDQEDGLPGQLRAGHLRHAETGVKSRLPDEGPVDVDAEKAPAWLRLAIADLAVISRQAKWCYE